MVILQIIIIVILYKKKRNRHESFVTEEKEYNKIHSKR
jgi:hypothetical protein